MSIDQEREAGQCQQDKSRDRVRFVLERMPGYDGSWLCAEAVYFRERSEDLAGYKGKCWVHDGQRDGSGSIANMAPEQ